MVIGKRNTWNQSKEGFEKEFVTDIVADGNRKEALKSGVSGKETDDKTKGAL